MKRSSLLVLPSLLLSLAVLPAACSSEPSEPDGSGGGGGESPEGAPCDFGEDADKCGGQDDVACTPALAPTSRSCDEDADCDDGELCFVSEEDPSEGTCQDIVGACLALPEVGNGLPFGEACDPDAATDPCAGQCVPIGDGASGECEENCRVLSASGCGEDVLEGSNVACGFFAYDLSDAGIEQGAGDLGVCATLCNCNADCPGEQTCLSAPSGDFAGICAGGLDSDVTLEECPDGAGGAGGSGG